MVKVSNPAKSYGSVSSTASVGKLEDYVYGLFFRGGIRHIAPYIPYRRPPGLTLCQRSAGANTRSIDNICPECAAAAKEVLGELAFA